MIAWVYDVSMSDSASTPPSLADRRRLQMMDDLAEAAIRLFTEVGFEETSMEDIADAVGVSRRTIYRHFPTKADLVFEHPRRWLEHFETVLASPIDGETARQRIERAIVEIGEQIAHDPEPVLQAFAVRNANPILGATHASSDQRWGELVFASLFAEHGEAAMFSCMICAGAFVGATNALILSWSLAYPDGDFEQMTRSALAQVDGLWPS